MLGLGKKQAEKEVRHYHFYPPLIQGVEVDTISIESCHGYI